MSHTPGPWEFRVVKPFDTRLALHYILAPDGHVIAMSYGDEMPVEDAALISAAPELLEAACSFVRFAETSGLQSTPDSPVGKARAAIAKATGCAA